MIIEPTKLDGKIREQVEKENKVRSQYQKIWGKLTEPETNAFYNQDFVNEKIRKSGFKELCPYQYTGHGDSYFVSKDMYESLIAVCRCGRKKSEGHIIKCLQKVKNKYSNIDIDAAIKAIEEHNATVKGSSNERNEDIGSPKYTRLIMEWNKATHYISPRSTMPGYKIDDHPYSVIFIG